MIVCPECQHPNPENRETCEGCGASLVGYVYRVCPRCNALNPADNAFCNRCLTPMSGLQDQDSDEDVSECVSPFVPGAESIPPQHPSAPKRRRVRDGERSDLADDLIRKRRAPLTHSKKDSRSSPPETSLSGEQNVTRLPRRPKPSSGASSRPDESESQSERPPFRGVPHRWEELDLLPIEAAIAGPHRPSYVPPRSPNQQEKDLAASFEHLVEGGASLAPRRRVRPDTREPMGMRLAQLVLRLALLAAALMAAVGSPHLVDLVTPRAGVLAMVDELSNLGSDDTVLLAFAYSPSFSGEMSTLADATVASLAARGVRIVGVALDPPGVALARQTLAKTEQSGADYLFGTDYIVAGYLSGYEAGARSLCQGWGGLQVDAAHKRSLADWPITAELPSAESVDRVVLLADDGAKARMWIEQVGACLQTPLDALVTGQLEAILTPYLLSGQLDHLVAGGVAAGEFELAAEAPAQALLWTDGYVALFVILALAAVAANVFYVSGEAGEAGR